MQTTTACMYVLKVQGTNATKRIFYSLTIKTERDCKDFSLRCLDTSAFNFSFVNNTKNKLSCCACIGEQKAASEIYHRRPCWYICWVSDKESMKPICQMASGTFHKSYGSCCHTRPASSLHVHQSVSCIHTGGLVKLLLVRTFEWAFQ